MILTAIDPYSDGTATIYYLVNGQERSREINLSAFPDLAAVIAAWEDDLRERAANF